MTSIDTPPTTLDAAQLRTWLERPDGPRLFDVRTPGEFAAAHVPGSYNVPLDLVTEHRRELAEQIDEDVVLVCRSGARAARAGDALSSTGLPHLHVLDGGIQAWEAAGGDLVRGDGTWDLERQVRLVAGGIVLAGVLASTVVPAAKWVSAGIGAGLTGAALTDTCAMGMMLSRLPHNRRATPEIGDVLAQLRN